MLEGEIIAGILLALLGLFILIKTDLYLRYVSWKMKKILGANFTPGERTKVWYKVIGVVLIVVGMLLIFY